MNRLWLIFAQTVTVALAILFVVTTLKPEWLPQPPGVVALQEAPAHRRRQKPAGSYREAARAALPSVVHIYTTQEIKQQRHPLLTTRFSATSLATARKASRNATPGSAPASSSAPTATS
jgi:S1-C subfamily serine protease